MIDPVSAHDQLNVALYSAGRSDPEMVEAATWFGEGGISLFAFFQDAAPDGPSHALYGHRDRLILQATHMSEWGLRLPALLVHDLDPDRDTLILETGFFLRHLDGFSSWLASARRQDFCHAPQGPVADSSIWHCAFLSAGIAA